MQSTNATEKNPLFYKSIKRCISFPIIHSRRLSLDGTLTAIQRVSLHELRRTVVGLISTHQQSFLQQKEPQTTQLGEFWKSAPFRIIYFYLFFEAVATNFASSITCRQSLSTVCFFKTKNLCSKWKRQDLAWRMLLANYIHLCS